MKNIDFNSISHVLISRTDSIGDVVLTLPLCGWLKSLYPNLQITFLGSSYTSPILKSCIYIDNYIEWDVIQKKPFKDQIDAVSLRGFDICIHVFPRYEIAYLLKKAKIPHRIGTTNRFYHWWSCNHLVRLSRKKSNLHESILNLLLVKPFIASILPTIEDIPKYYGLIPDKNIIWSEKIKKILDQKKKIIILHPKSKGSAREWPIKHWTKLVEVVAEIPQSPFIVVVTGTNSERELLTDFIKQVDEKVINLAGKLSLSEFISFIGCSYALVAASTGPLHIAAALGLKAIGIYPPIKPIHPERWKPIGFQAVALSAGSNDCKNCKNNPFQCSCMSEVAPEAVFEAII